MAENSPSAPGMIEEVSYRSAEINRLEQSIPLATNLGKAITHRLIMEGPANRDDVLARQEALQELVEKPALNEALLGGLKAFGKHEVALRELEKKKGSSLTTYMGAGRAARDLVELIKAVDGNSSEAPESVFLRDHLLSIGTFNDTNLAGMLRGPLYYTPGGLRSRDQLSRLRPFLRFRPYISGRLGLLMAGGAGGVDLGLIPSKAFEAAAMFGGMAIMFSLMPNPNSGSTMKDEAWNQPTVYNRLRDQLRVNPEYARALLSVGNLDTAVALGGLKAVLEENGHPTVIPTIESDGPFHFKASGIRNPLLALKPDRQVVPNDLEFGGDTKLTFLTGPNSGGKSTLAKNILQNQILAQIGGPVVAESASMTLPDRVAYHVPMPPDLEEETGRLGFELGRVRGILDASSERSLTILDDCLDGTTHEERVKILKTVMLAFRNLGGATLFSTHAHELVEEFESQGEGQFLQVEFSGDSPTYRLQPGVSHSSHADRVAVNYGFTDEQVLAELRERGIASARWF